MKKYALISVFDKDKIVDFAKNLNELGWGIISTGGTYSKLKDKGIDVIPVEEVTEFPEILGGRVKTLNPKIFGGILYRRDNKEDKDIVNKMEIPSIDMVVCNLYPFEETIKNTDDRAEIIEMIDIGGPSMLRAAAKNHKDVIVVTDIEDYDIIIERLKAGEVDETMKLNLAIKAFATTQRYDSAIVNYFGSEDYSMSFENKVSLRYGENPHQSAAFYENSDLDEIYKADMKIHHGKELSYNNYNDLYGAVKFVKDFDECACIAVKHSNPCGMAIGENPKDAYMKAYECDTESIFGGIIAFNREVDSSVAEEMAKIFLEIIVAPSFTDEAMEILKEKKNIRLITIENFENYNIPKLAYKETINGILVQDYDRFQDDNPEYCYPSKRRPSEEEMKNLDFAWKAVKSVASNGVVLAKNGATVGIGQGQTKRSWAVENALERAIDLDGAVMASDAFFFEDTVELLNKFGVKAVIQPGGSIHDEEVIKLCDKYDIALVFTGRRHFRH